MAEGRSRDLLAPVLACMEGRLSPNVALMQLASTAPDTEGMDDALREARRYVVLLDGRVERLNELHALRASASGTLQAVRDVAAVAQRAHTESQDWAQMFDRAAQISPEASVALYSLGDPTLLQAQTEELVAQMAKWGLLHAHFRVLDFGCGIGRVAAAIAGHVRQVTALDVSGEMARLARERTRTHRNVSVLQAPPDGLEGFAHASFEVILAIDSFPYVVDSGLATSSVKEMARVLTPDGHLLIMNYSYRTDPGQDGAELRALAGEYGFAIEREGTSDLSLWDGRAFLLRKRC